MNDKEIEQLFDVSSFEKEVKLKSLLTDMRLDVWIKSTILFAILTGAVALFLQYNFSARSIEKAEIIRAGLGEYRQNPMTGETEFKLFKVVNGQLVKE